MYAVYRVCMKEYIPGVGWIDDGCIYSTQEHVVEQERDRRKNLFYQESGNAHGSIAEIVIVHESFLRDLHIHPILSTMKGPHPADQGLLSEHKAKVKAAQSLCKVSRTVAQRARNTNVLSPVL